MPQNDPGRANDPSRARGYAPHIEDPDPPEPPWSDEKCKRFAQNVKAFMDAEKAAKGTDT